MDTKKLSWPEHYPSKCPPKEATDVSGAVYRFTNRVIPKQNDFQSYYEMKPGNDWGSKACQARGLSVYTSEEDCKMASATVPALRRKKICIAQLTRDVGLIAPTPSKNGKNHKTLWPLFTPQDLANKFIPVKVTYA